MIYTSADSKLIKQVIKQVKQVCCAILLSVLMFCMYCGIIIYYF